MTSRYFEFNIHRSVRR